MARRHKSNWSRSLHNLSAGEWSLPALICAGILLFYIFMVQTGTGSQTMSVLLALAVLFCAIGAVPMAHLKQRFSLPVLALLAYLIMNGLAGLYSHFGNYAVQDFSAIFSAFCIAALVLLRMRDNGGHGLVSMLAWISAIISLFCIDASSLRIFSRFLTDVLGHIGYAYSMDAIGYESGIRITGIFANANVSAGFIAFGVLLSLYLISTAQNNRDKFLAFFLLGLNSLAFLLSFSMGAMAAFLLAVAVYLIFAQKGSRIRLFLTMLDALVVSLIMAFLAMLGLGADGLISILSVLAGLFSGPLMWMVDRFILIPVSARLEKNRKMAGGAVIALVALLIAYIILAFNLTGPITLSAGESLNRSVYPAAGDYTVSGTWSGDVEVTVISQNSAQTMMHTHTVLYDGPLSDAAFTVPEGTRVVYFQFSAQSDVCLEQVTLSDGSSLKLGYRLLPGFAANRIQGLWANQNFIQRLVFFQDGLTLFMQSPIIGHGLGSVEGLLTSVQSFYYETKYIHNHLIQILDEMGLVGLACFATLIVSVAVILIKRRREKTDVFDPMLPALSACLAMMIGHSMTEIVWSVGVYQVAALLLLAVMIVRYAKPIKCVSASIAGWISQVLLWAYCLVFGALMSGHLFAYSTYLHYTPTSVQSFMADMKSLIRIEAYDSSGYKLNYILNAVHYGTEEELELAARYAADIRALGNYELGNQLGEAYYLPLSMIEDYFAYSREIIAQEASNADAWNLQFAAYRSFYPEYGAHAPETWAQGVLTTYEWLQEFNQDRMETISLSDENMAFVEEMIALEQS